MNYEPEKMQIIHVAYSTWGKVAFTGYYQDFNGRADKLEGLWEANVLGNGSLSTPVRLPIPGDFHGITDLQWTPDGAASSTARPSSTSITRALATTASPPSAW